MIYEVQISNEYGNIDRVLFTDKSKAEKFARDISEDDGLAGIADASVVEFSSDDAAVDEWWTLVEKEGLE